MPHTIIVVTVAIGPQCNVHATVIDGVGGNKTFNVPLSPTGSLPVTHYWCAWMMSQADYNNLFGLMATFRSLGTARFFDFTARTAQQVLTTMGLSRVNLTPPPP